MKVIAKKINNPNCGHLTEGEVYRVLNFDKFGFDISDDDGDVITCLYKDCPHTKGNWTIITDKAKVR